MGAFSIPTSMVAGGIQKHEHGYDSAVQTNGTETATLLPS